MGRHYKSAQASVLSYHGLLTMFDDQGCFDAIFLESVEMYKISTQSSNAVSIFERNRDNEDLRRFMRRFCSIFSLMNTTYSMLGKTYLSFDKKSLLLLLLH